MALPRAQVFRVSRLEHGKHLYKVEVNATENRLTGVCVTTRAGTNAVVVEGDSKGMRRFHRLMMHRIDWNPQVRLPFAVFVTALAKVAAFCCVGHRMEWSPQACAVRFALPSCATGYCFNSSPVACRSLAPAQMMTCLKNLTSATVSGMASSPSQRLQISGCTSVVGTQTRASSWRNAVLHSTGTPRSSLCPPLRPLPLSLRALQLRHGRSQIEGAQANVPK